jgi:hypothetical protein
VRLARRLAGICGIALRFDLAGLGDSDHGQDTLPYPDTVYRDVQAAFHHLEKTEGRSCFVLAGICSGADNALAVAVRDRRVVGVILVDGLGCAYRTAGFCLRHYGRRVLSLGGWTGFARRRLNSIRAQGQFARPPVGGANSFGGWVPPMPPPRSRTAAQFRTLVERGVRLDVAYTGGVSDYYNYAGQFADSFRDVDFKGLLRVAYLSQVNHTFTEMHAQDALLDSTADWLREQFPPAGALGEAL